MPPKAIPVAGDSVAVEEPNNPPEAGFDEPNNPPDLTSVLEPKSPGLSAGSVFVGVPKRFLTAVGFTTSGLVPVPNNPGVDSSFFPNKFEIDAGSDFEPKRPPEDEPNKPAGLALAGLGVGSFGEGGGVSTGSLVLMTVLSSSASSTSSEFCSSPVSSSPEPLNYK